MPSGPDFARPINGETWPISPARSSNTPLLTGRLAPIFPGPPRPPGPVPPVAPNGNFVSPSSERARFTPKGNQTIRDPLGTLYAGMNVALGTWGSRRAIAAQVGHVSTLANNTLPHFFRNTADGLPRNVLSGLSWAGMGAGLATITTGWKDPFGAASNVNTLYSTTRTVASKTGLGSFSQALGKAAPAVNGVMAGVGLGASAYSLYKTFTGEGYNSSVIGNVMKTANAGLAAYGAVASINTLATTLGFAKPLAFAGPAGWIAMGGIAAAAIATMWYKGWKSNQADKVEDSIITNVMNLGVEGMGNEKYRDRKELKDAYTVMDAVKGKIDAFGFAAFKGLPVEARAEKRFALAEEVAKEIQAGKYSQGKSGQDLENHKNRLLQLVCVAAFSNEDLKDGLRELSNKLPQSEKQKAFDQYVDGIKARAKQTTGDPYDKKNPGAMKKGSSSSNQWDWMEASLADFAIELGVRYAPQYVTPSDKEGQKELKQAKIRIQNALTTNNQKVEKLENQEKNRPIQPQTNNRQTTSYMGPRGVQSQQQSASLSFRNLAFPSRG